MRKSLVSSMCSEISHAKHIVYGLNQVNNLSSRLCPRFQVLVRLLEVLFKWFFDEGARLMIPVKNTALTKDDTCQALNIVQVLLFSKYFVDRSQWLLQVRCKLRQKLSFSTQ